jgi:hypothetical protein
MAAHSMLLPAALLLAVPLAASPLRAQGVEYALGSSSYHVSTATKGTQTSPMGNQEFDVGVEQRITVNIARQAKDTLIATLTIDSISLKSSGPTPDVSRYQGTKFTSKLSPTGRVYSTKGPEGADVLLGQLSESIARFLPTYRRDLHPGLTWSDSTTGKAMQQGMEVDRTIIADYIVTGDTSIAGEKAFAVKRHTSSKAAGSGSPGGNAVSRLSATRSDASFVLSPRGVYLGGTSNDDIDLTLTIVAQGAEINVRQKAVQTVQRIR